MPRKRTTSDKRAQFGDAWIDNYATAARATGIGTAVTQAPNKPPVPTEIIAQEIQAISDAMKNINAGKLNRKALVVLLAHSTGLAQKDIKLVLDSLGELGKLYLKP